MSRINELKKQYPELNITMFDLMVRLDTTKTHKYLPLMCKIFGKRFNAKEMWHKDELSMGLLELQSNLINKGISTDGLTDNQMFYLSNYITENFTIETYHTLNLFMEYMDKNMIEKNDVTSYKDIDDIRGAVTLATMKELTKELEGQVIKEYEDEKWVIVRPLNMVHQQDGAQHIKKKKTILKNIGDEVFWHILSIKKRDISLRVTKD